MVSRQIIVAARRKKARTVHRLTWWPRQQHLDGITVANSSSEPSVPCERGHAMVCVDVALRCLSKIIKYECGISASSSKSDSLWFIHVAIVFNEYTVKDVLVDLNPI